MKNDNSDSYLDDLEKEKVIQFFEDDVMREAVKKVILEPIYFQGTLKKGQKADPTKNFGLVFVSNNKGLTDGRMGSYMRALWEGINFVEMGFAKLSTFKRELVIPKKGQNQAR